MKKYSVNVVGTVHDTETDFKCGFDITVENGGSLDHIGKSVQDAFNRMAEEAVVEKAAPVRG